jgi:DnaK suppressor protein
MKSQKRAARMRFALKKSDSKIESKVIAQLRMSQRKLSMIFILSGSRMWKGVPVMNTEITLKFKTLFEEQKKALLYSNKYNAEFSTKSEEMSDELDLAAVELEQGMRMRLRSREALFAKKINESLEKIQAGTFGVCECCEEDIELSRLEVRPTANLCINCKEAEEMREIRSADGRKSKSSGMKPELRIA